MELKIDVEKEDSGYYMSIHRKSKMLRKPQDTKAMRNIQHFLRRIMLFRGSFCTTMSARSNKPHLATQSHIEMNATKHEYILFPRKCLGCEKYVYHEIVVPGVSAG